MTLNPFDNTNPFVSSSSDGADDRNPFTNPFDDRTFSETGAERSNPFAVTSSEEPEGGN